MGHKNVLRLELTRMKHMVRDKHKGWRAFCEDSGLQSPWEVVRWARDPWGEKERMGRLTGANGLWVDGDEEKVRCLVSEVFGTPSVDAQVLAREWDRYPITREELECSVRKALGGQRTARRLGLMGSVIG